MTPVVPDPMRAVPLPLRAQSDVRDRWLTQRLLDVLPRLRDRSAIDLWLVVGREHNEDPVLATLLPARRRTMLALHRSDDGVTGASTRSSTRPTPPPSSRRGRRRPSTWPGGSDSASTTWGSNGGSSRRSPCNGPECRCSRLPVGCSGPPSPPTPSSSRASSSTATSACSLGLKTDTQRNGYVLRDAESTAPEGLSGALRTGNRTQDLTTAALTVGRTGNEVLAAAREAARAEGIDADVYSHPVGFHGHGAGPVIGQWDQQGGVPGAGDCPVHPDTVYALELAIRRPVPEWGGQCVRMALEQGIALTADGVEYFDGRQTELILIPS